MKRPIGVTLAAAVAILGSIVALFFAAGFAFSANQPMPGPISYRGFAYGLAIFTAGMAILGVATAMGLLKLRAWARMSILVFAAAMTALFALTAIVMFVMPAQPEAGITPDKLRVVRAVVAGVFGVPVLVGVWWLWMFNTRKIKDAFNQAEAGLAAETGVPIVVGPRRPIAVSVIGWLSVVGGAFMLLAALGSPPAMLFGYLLTGWAATLFFVINGGISTFLGRGLLKLDERARIAMLGWMAFTVFHMGFVALVPSARERTFAAQRAFQDSAMAGSGATVQPFNPPETFMYVVWGFSVAVVLLMAWFLVRERGAFHVPQHDSGPPQ